MRLMCAEDGIYKRRTAAQTLCAKEEMRAPSCPRADPVLYRLHEQTK